MRSILRWGIILAFCIMLFFVSAARVFAQTTPDSGDDGLFPDAEGMDSANTISESSEVVRSRLVNIRLDLLPRPDAALGSQSSTSETLLLDLFDDVVYTATLDRIEPISADMYAWIGSLEGIEFSQVIMVVDNNDIISANITSPEGIYQVRYVSEGVHAVRQIDQSQFQGCGLDEGDHEKTPLVAGLQGEMEMPPSLDSPATSAEVMSDSGAVIDVLVVYTPAARAAAGGFAAIGSLINLAVTETNNSYANSNVTQRINLVHTAEVSYTESGSMGTDLYRLRLNLDGYMDDVHSLRDTYKADLVSLFVDSGDYCGIAYLLTVVDPAMEYLGFSVVDYSCATGYYSFGHELGHNMGARHDRRVDNTNGSPFSYNHGYVNVPDQWRTIMGYNTECYENGVYCTRLQYWSNPDVSYGGDPMGIASGAADAADNHLALNNTASTVANFRDNVNPTVPNPRSPAGIIETDQVTFTWDAAGEATGYVLRVKELYPNYTTNEIYNLTYTSEQVCVASTCSKTISIPEPTDGIRLIWDVHSSNDYGNSAWSDEKVFAILSSPPEILLVSDWNLTLSEYTDTLDALGINYYVWDTFYRLYPMAADDFANFSTIIWFTGELWEIESGPNSAEEPAVEAWLDSGGCFFFNSQDYIWSRWGLNSFLMDYFGVSVVDEDVGQDSVVGTGSVFGGFGPYTLFYPFDNWSDTITPDGTAEAAFMGNYGNAAVNKSNGTYKTTFWAFPFEALPSLSARNETMEAFLGWCGTISPQAPTLSAPQGDIDELRPEYTWNKVDTATSYDLLVKDASGTTVINQTYAADETNCPSSGSVCSVTPAVSLYCTSSYTWQVSANNIYGTRTSLEQNFKVAGFYVYERQSEYTWDKVDTAISYDLLVKDADEVSVINQSYAADETNCPASGSVCAVTPAVTLDYASYTLQVSARDASGVIGSIEQCFSVRYLTYIAFIYK